LLVSGIFSFVSFVVYGEIGKSYFFTISTDAVTKIFGVVTPLSNEIVLENSYYYSIPIMILACSEGEIFTTDQNL